MISGRIAERRWLKEPTQLQWRVTLPSAKATLLFPIKKDGYLSLNRKNPAADTKMLNAEIIESQFGLSVSLVYPNLNILVQYSLNWNPSDVPMLTPIKNVMMEPTKTITNIF